MGSFTGPHLDGYPRKGSLTEGLSATFTLSKERFESFVTSVRVWLKGRAPDLGLGGLGSIPSTLGGCSETAIILHLH